MIEINVEISTLDPVVMTIKPGERIAGFHIEPNLQLTREGWLLVDWPIHQSVSKVYDN